MQIINGKQQFVVECNHHVGTAMTLGEAEHSDFLEMAKFLENGEISSYMKEMTAFGVQEFEKTPDIASMTTDEFLQHLIDVQNSLVSVGVEKSEMTDPNSLTEEELLSLQEEMQMPSTLSSMELLNLNFVDYSTLSTGILDSIFGCF